MANELNVFCEKMSDEIMNFVRDWKEKVESGESDTLAIGLITKDGAIAFELFEDGTYGIEVSYKDGVIRHRIDEEYINLFQEKCRSDLKEG